MMPLILAPFDPWMILLVAFMVIEGLAIMTKPTGDTLSAHAWAFLHNAPARLALVLCLTYLLLVRLIEIGGNQFTLGTWQT